MRPEPAVCRSFDVVPESSRNRVSEPRIGTRVRQDATKSPKVLHRSWIGDPGAAVRPERRLLFSRHRTSWTIGSIHPSSMTATNYRLISNQYWLRLNLFWFYHMFKLTYIKIEEWFVRVADQFSGLLVYSSLFDVAIRNNQLYYSCINHIIIHTLWHSIMTWNGWVISLLLI